MSIHRPSRYEISACIGVRFLVGLAVFCLLTIQVFAEIKPNAEVAEQIKAVLSSAMEEIEEDESGFADFDETVEDAEVHEGLFTLYHKKDKLYAEIRSDQMETMYLAPMAIARGLASAGTPLNFGDEWVLAFKRVDDNVQLIRKNIRYEAPSGSPLEKAVEQNYTDSILQSIPIVAENSSNQSVLIDFGEIFLSDFADLGLGWLDSQRTTWHKIRAYEDNIELQVECTFDAGYGWGYFFGDSGVIDDRGTTVVLHYSLINRPDNGYSPRYADYRVGHFISATKDFGSDDPTTMFRRRINRWHLEKANPDLELSAPKKQIVWWVENTVPHEYRPYVEDGILEWNKAFEKIGFRNAIGVRWQNDGDDFDPEDTKYCTFRWITTPYTYAMSGLRADPITGEMIDGDVIFDASWVRLWKNEYALLVGSPLPSGSAQQPQSPTILGVGQVISPMMAARNGFGLPHKLPHQQQAQPGADQQQLHVVPSSSSSLQMALHRRVAAGHMASCQCASAKQHEYALAAMALAAARNAQGDEQDNDDDGDAEDEEEIQLPPELVGQAIKEVVMHEVGHSLGLRHNFKASTIRSLDELNDEELTSKQGMVGSVMDYNPLNVARLGQKQGEFAATTIGPYDYWAIEYAYKPIDGDEEEELAEIASRSPDPELVFATDEDLYMSNDPLVNAFDLGDDPLAYAKDRMELAAELLEGLDDRIVREGESWARLRSGFSVLLAQYGNAAYIASSYIGGQHVARDTKGGEESRDPVVPVDFKQQREAMQFLADNILTTQPFQFSPSILRRITTERWYDWGSSMFFYFGGDFDVYRRVSGIQSIALSHCLNASVLRRVQNQALMAEPDDQPLQMSEIFETLTDAVWKDVKKSTEGSAGIMTRNLQRDHLKRLCRIVLGNRSNYYGDSFIYLLLSGGSSSYPADARSLAVSHLSEISDKIDQAMELGDLDATSSAHLEECRDIIKKTRNAGVDRNQL